MEKLRMTPLQQNIIYETQKYINSNGIMPLQKEIALKLKCSDTAVCRVYNDPDKYDLLDLSPIDGSALHQIEKDILSMCADWLQRGEKAPSQKYMADEIGCSTATLSRHYLRLRDRGFITMRIQSQRSTKITEAGYRYLKQQEKEQ